MGYFFRLTDDFSSKVFAKVMSVPIQLVSFSIMPYHLTQQNELFGRLSFEILTKKGLRKVPQPFYQWRDMK